MSTNRTGQNSKYITESTGLANSLAPKYRTLNKDLGKQYLASLIPNTTDIDPTKLVKLLTDYKKILKDFVEAKGGHGNIVIDYRNVHVVLLQYLVDILYAINKLNVVEKTPQINKLYGELMEYLQKHCSIKEGKNQTTKFYTAFSSITPNCYLPLYNLAVSVLYKSDPDALLTNDEKNLMSYIIKLMGEMISPNLANFSKVDSRNLNEISALYNVMIHNFHRARIYLGKIEAIAENNVSNAQKLELIPPSMVLIYPKLIKNLQDKGAVEEAITIKESYLNHLEWNHSLLNKNAKEMILQRGDVAYFAMFNLSAFNIGITRKELFEEKYQSLQNTKLLEHFNENKLNLENKTLTLKNNDNSLLFIAILQNNDINCTYLKESRDIVILDLHLVNIQDLLRAFADYKLALSEKNLSPEDQLKKKTESFLHSIFKMTITIPNEPKDEKTDDAKVEKIKNESEAKEGEETKTQNSENKKKKKKKKKYSNESKPNQPSIESEKEKQSEIQPKFIFGGVHTYFNNPTVKKTLNANTVFKLHGGTPRHYIRVSQDVIDQINAAHGINKAVVFNWMLSMLDRGKIGTDKGFICAENSAVGKDESKGLRLFGVKEEVITDSNKKQHTVYVITSIEGKNWKTAKGLRGEDLQNEGLKLD